MWRRDPCADAGEVLLEVHHKAKGHDGPDQCEDLNRPPIEPRNAVEIVAPAVPPIGDPGKQRDGERQRNRGFRELLARQT